MPGHDGKLVNHDCTKYKGDTCQEKSIKEYDLADPVERATMNSLHVVCRIAGEHYKICKDKPGFCRFTYKKNCVLGIFCQADTKTENYIPVIPYQFILDSGVVCASQDHYSWDELK
jgi:hypothetical protein